MQCAALEQSSPGLSVRVNAERKCFERQRHFRDHLDAFRAPEGAGVNAEIAHRLTFGVAPRVERNNDTIVFETLSVPSLEPGLVGVQRTEDLSSSNGILFGQLFVAPADARRLVNVTFEIKNAESCGELSLEVYPAEPVAL